MTAVVANGRRATAAAAVPRKPAPLDLDAARAEAAADDVEFTFGGESFTIPPMLDWPLSLQTKLDVDGDLFGTLGDLLGDEQMERFMAHDPRFGDLVRLFDHLGVDAGIGGLGNSSGRRGRGSTRT